MTPVALARTLFARLKDPEFAEDARKRVRFALLALREAPARGGSTPAGLLAGHPTYAAALDAVEQFLDAGRWPDRGAVLRRLAEANDDLGLSDAARTAGRGVTELVLAVERLLDDEPNLADVASLADRAAAFAARAGEDGYTEESVLYLERLQRRLFNLAPIDRPG